MTSERFRFEKTSAILQPLAFSLRFPLRLGENFSHLNLITELYSEMIPGLASPASVDYRLRISAERK